MILEQKCPVLFWIWFQRFLKMIYLFLKITVFRPGKNLHRNRVPIFIVFLVFISNNYCTSTQFFSWILSTYLLNFMISLYTIQRIVGNLFLVRNNTCIGENNFVSKRKCSLIYSTFRVPLCPRTFVQFWIATGLARQIHFLHPLVLATSTQKIINIRQTNMVTNIHTFVPEEFGLNGGVLIPNTRFYPIYMQVFGYYRLFMSYANYPLFFT